MLVFFLFVNLLFQDVVGINSLTGEEIEFDKTLRSSEFILYIGEPEPCQQCASEIFNYGMMDGKDNIPKMIVLSSNTAEVAKASLKGNNNSGTNSLFKRPYFIVPITDKAELLNILDIDGTSRIYYFKNGNGSVVKDELIAFLQENF